jgi:hypothetical protein
VEVENRVKTANTESAKLCLNTVQCTMRRQTPVIKEIVESRMAMSYSDYLQRCIETVETLPQKDFLDGLGDLIDQKTKSFVCNKFRK